MKKIFMLMLISLLSLFLVCCDNDTAAPNNDEIPEETKDNEKDDEIIQSNEKNENTPEIIDYSHAIFVSPNGNGDGSIDNPCSLKGGINKLCSNKNEVYLYEGTYNLTEPIILNSEARSDLYYKISSFEDDKVILDFGKDYRKNPEVTGKYNSEKSKGIVIKGNYYYIEGLTITNCGASGIHISGSYNKVENCILAYNGNTGLSISSSSSNPKDTWAHDNLVLNCTSYGNYDWDRLDLENQGEDADGFGCKITSGPNNVFDGCISYNNSDDGWDLFTKQLTGKIGSVTIKNCVAFNNGYSITGDDLKNGNGFKLGGRAIEVDHFVSNSIAFNNKMNGFDDNSNPGTITLKNCTGYNNGSRNFAMGRFLEEDNIYTSTWYEGNQLMGPIENVPKSHNVFENIISYNVKVTDSYSGTANNCYFYTTSNKYYFIMSGLCNSKYTKGSLTNIFNPFKKEEIDLNDLDNIHYLHRNKDHTVNLNGFLSIKDNYTFGASL